MLKSRNIKFERLTLRIIAVNLRLFFSSNQNQFVLPTLDVIPTSIYNQYNMYSTADINSKDKQTFKYITKINFKNQVIHLA